MKYPIDFLILFTDGGGGGKRTGALYIWNHPFIYMFQ